jgi:hypothetical protein
MHITLEELLSYTEFNCHLHDMIAASGRG